MIVQAVIKKLSKKAGAQPEMLVHQIFQDDIFLVSYPKSGNTWLSFLLGNLMAEKEGKEVKLNFFNILDYVPDYDQPYVQIRRDGVGRFPRIIKSHMGVNEYFPKVVLLVRDPRDVMVSYYHYLKGLGRIHPESSIKDVIISPSYGIKAWVAHTKGWLERADKGKRVRVFRYEDFMRHTSSELEKTINILGWKVSSHMIQKAIKHSSFESMRDAEKTTRSPDYPLTASKFWFVRKGKIQKGKELGQESKSIIDNQAGELMTLLGYV